MKEYMLMSIYNIGNVIIVPQLIQRIIRWTFCRKTLQRIWSVECFVR